jgi:type IX secretion system PorP/SprF family membrane protein
MKKNLLTLLFALFICFETFGQDPQFSQFYAAPLYLNPAFTGTTAEHRFVMNYRNQWMTLPQSFVTHAFSYDLNMKNLNSGFGVLFTTDKAGSASLRSSTANLLYSYKIHLADKWVIKPGISFGYGVRNINYSKLIFGDQLAFGNPDAPTIDPAITSYGNVNYFDFSSGILIYNKNLWIGVSSYHMNEPNQSLLGEESILHRKNSLHAGYRIPLYKGPQKRDNISSIAPSFIYKSQGEFDQLDLGLQFNYNPVMVGFWYRGLPVKQNARDNLSQDAVVFLFALKFDNYDIGYSYDMTVSELGATTGGSHEISLIYQVDLQRSKKAKRREKYIPCPTF